jgi:Rad/Gem-related GTP binding protein 1
LEESISQKLQELKLIQADDMCVVRNFATSSRGLINRGDSFKRKSNQSIASDVGSCGSCGGGERSRGLSGNSSVASSIGVCPPLSKVLMLGDIGVGKTALLQQFMTSEYMGAIETSFGELVHLF